MAIDSLDNVSRDAGALFADQDMARGLKGKDLVAARDERIKNADGVLTKQEMKDWTAGYNEKAGLDKGFLARVWDSIKNAVGIERDPQTVARNISLDPSKQETLNSLRDHDKGAYLKTVNQLSPRELQAAQERYMRPNQTITDEQAQAMSWNGAVREGTTGKMYNTKDSEIKVARGYVQEQKDRANKHEQSLSR